jgi:hypothetical protein
MGIDGRLTWKPQGLGNMRWVVHVGIQKSGSKAIQRFLAAETSAGPTAGVYFPEQGREGIWHQPLYLALREENGKHLDSALAARPLGGQNIGVFSYEELHELPPPGIRIIREKLGQSQIVILIRRQDLAVNSLLNQYVKAHRVSFGQVMDFKLALVQYDRKFDYQATLSRWAHVFGAEAITPIVYDKHTDVVRQFCDATGIGFTHTVETLPNPNPALSRRAYNAFLSAKADVSDTSELPKLVNHLRCALASELIDTRSEEGPLLLGDDERRRILSFYEASNERVRSEWFPSRSSLFEA